MVWRFRPAALGVAVLVAGCATQAPVPAVEDARDARGADPCALVDEARLAELGLPGTGVASSAPEGPRCEWRAGPDRALTLTLYTDGGGLATLAENSEPTTTRVRVAGYPALETFTGRGDFCQYDVGIAPQQVVLAALEGGRPDSCTALQAVLPAVLAELPPLPG